jgi:hypothetical protein
MDVVVDGRFCAPVSKNVFCCLPCPMTDFLYPQSKPIAPLVLIVVVLILSGFNTYYRVAEALNVAGLVLLVFLLISFLILPAEKTRRHYLSYCLIIAAIFMAVSTCITEFCTHSNPPQLGFVIPLGAKPEQCYNEITPNDMYSSLACAFSGAFLISGGLSMAVWSTYSPKAMAET